MFETLIVFLSPVRYSYAFFTDLDLFEESDENKNKIRVMRVMQVREQEKKASVCHYLSLL